MAEFMVFLFLQVVKIIPVGSGVETYTQRGQTSVLTNTFEHVVLFSLLTCI